MSVDISLILTAITCAAALQASIREMSRRLSASARTVCLPCGNCVITVEMCEAAEGGAREDERERGMSQLCLSPSLVSSERRAKHFLHAAIW